MPLLPPGTEIDETLCLGLRVDIEPRGKGRPRAGLNKRTGKLNARTDDKTLEWAKTFRQLTMRAIRMNQDSIKMMDGKPLYIELELYFQKPKKAEWFCTSPVDNDNSEKNVWDAMQHSKVSEAARAVMDRIGTRVEKDLEDGFFKNDNRIVANATFKAWAPSLPYLNIRIMALKKKGT